MNGVRKKDFSHFMEIYFNSTLPSDVAGVAGLRFKLPRFMPILPNPIVRFIMFFCRCYLSEIIQTIFITLIYSLVSALQALIKEYINFLVYTLGTVHITNYLEYKTAT